MMQFSQLGKCVLAMLPAVVMVAFEVSAQPLPRLAGSETTMLGGLTAYLIDPTEDYDHGVFGEKTEASGFAVESRSRVLRYRLPKGAVFEDRRVRLADLDGDGKPEAIVVKAYQTRGAALATYRILSDRIVPLAESKSLGTAHRWINPVGIAAFAGDGEAMIAAVVTPHLTGSLRLFRLNGNRLESVARIDGFTNHMFGSRDLDLARIDDVDDDGVPEVVLPSIDRRSLAAISFKEGQASVLRQVHVPFRIVALMRAQGGVAVVRNEAYADVEIDLRVGGE